MPSPCPSPPETDFFVTSSSASPGPVSGAGAGLGDAKRNRLHSLAWAKSVFLVQFYCTESQKTPYRPTINFSFEFSHSLTSPRHRRKQVHETPQILSTVKTPGSLGEKSKVSKYRARLLNLRKSKGVEPYIEPYSDLSHKIDSFSMKIRNYIKNMYKSKIVQNYSEYRE